MNIIAGSVNDVKTSNLSYVRLILHLPAKALLSVNDQEDKRHLVLKAFCLHHPMAFVCSPLSPIPKALSVEQWGRVTKALTKRICFLGIHGECNENLQHQGCFNWLVFCLIATTCPL